jgi:hypothetical protein
LFTTLATEAGINKDDWKEELHDRLSVNLKMVSAAEYLKESVTFVEYAIHVQQLCNDVPDDVVAAKPASTAAASSGRDRRPNRNKLDKPSSPATPTSSDSKALTLFDPKADFKANATCYNCNKKGHFSKDYPKVKVAIKLVAKA